jgi:hypothetical protein
LRRRHNFIGAGGRAGELARRWPRNLELKGATMERPELLRKLESMLDVAAREKMWGNFELEIRDGVPTVLRKLTTERLTGARETTHASEFPKNP